MGVEETALELIGLTYDAVLAPEKWPALMERLIKAMGARSAMLREVDYDAGDVGLFEAVGYVRPMWRPTWRMSVIPFHRSPTTKSRSPSYR